MTLNELIEELTDFRDSDAGHGDSEVMMTADYGDHSHTEQALEIRRVERRDLYETAYSKSGLAVIDPRKQEEGDEDEAVKSAIVLR